MSWAPEREGELSAIITKFSLYIRSYIHKYRVLDFGVDPEDVFQEVRIRLWKALCNENIIHKPSSYIKKVVTTVVIDQLRKYKREEGILSIEKTKQISESNSNYLSRLRIDDRDSQIVLDNALDNLKISRRTVVKLYLLNMRVPEIASTFNWSLNKTRNLLYRGLSDLKKALKHGQSNHDI
jgi:RNA polymerase sigma factor (sigma-70 family)